MLFEAFKSRAAGLPASSGLRNRDGFRSYQDAVESIEQAAAVLLARGVEPGDRVALLLPNSPALFIATHALFAIGAVAVPLSTQSNARELAWAAGACDIAAIVLVPGAEPAAWSHRGAGPPSCGLRTPGGRPSSTSLFSSGVPAPHTPSGDGGGSGGGGADDAQMRTSTLALRRSSWSERWAS